MTYKTWLYIAVGFTLTLSITGCGKEGSNLDKLYSRNLTLHSISEAELGTVLSSIATATDTAQTNVRKDADGNNMFLYSNNDVVIFVRRKFDEPCSELGCSWKVDISPTDTALPQDSQKELVDIAFTSIGNSGILVKGAEAPK